MQVHKTLIQLKERIVDISYKHKLSHIGSCLTAVEILYNIYLQIDSKDEVVLSNGHAGLAWYVLLEDVYGINAEELLNKHGIHPNRDIEAHIPVSTGSLGHGIGIAVGLAQANPSKGYYVVISDGEMSEGSVYEAIRYFSEKPLPNLFIAVNYNGYGAMRKTNIDQIVTLMSLLPKDRYAIYYLSNPSLPYLEGLKGHYTVLTERQYIEVRDYLKKGTT